MAKDLFWTTVTFTIILTILLLAFWPKDARQYIKYDCSISEISPDYPIEVKEGCRKLHMEQYKK